CRVDSLTIFWEPPSNSSVNTANLPLTFAAVQTQDPGNPGWQTDPAGFAIGGLWEGSDKSVTLKATNQGLQADFPLQAVVTPPSLIRADVPPILPSVVTTGLADSNINLATPHEFP